MSSTLFFRTRTMWSPIGVLWTLLSTIVAALTAFSFLQPYWFINRRTFNSLGMFSYCIRDMRTKGNFAHVCGIYGGEFNFSNLPSNAWQVACVLYGGGALLLCLAACLGLITICLPRAWDKRVSAATGYVQTTAVVIMIAGLVIYPIGLDTKFVRHYCSSARIYDAGDCQIGWSYLLGIVGTSLAVFTPFLSQYTDLNLQELPEHEPRQADTKHKPPTFV